MKEGKGVKDLDCYRVECVVNEYINDVWGCAYWSAEQIGHLRDLKGGRWRWDGEKTSAHAPPYSPGGK